MTPNHPGGAVAGPNDLQNAPVLTAVTAGGSSTSVVGSFNSTPGTTFTLQFFTNTTADRSGFGQGQALLGTTTVTTDAAGNAPIAIDFPISVPGGAFVSATATDPGGNTSEFSNSLPGVPITLQFSVAAYTANLAGGIVTIIVTRTGDTGGLVTVDYSTGGGNATAGTDYTATSGTLTFNPGQSSATFNISLFDNHQIGSDKTVNITLSNPTHGATLGTPSTATLTIKNTNSPTLQFGTDSYSVNEGDGSVTITVTRNTALATSTIVYATGGGSGVPGVDYQPTSGTLTFSPGQTSQTFTIPILDAGRVSGSQTVGLTLSGVTGAQLGAPGVATLTINDNDPPATIQFATPKYNVTGAVGTATVYIVRTGNTGGTTTVAYFTFDGSAKAGVDYVPTSGTLTFNPGEAIKSITIPITGGTPDGTTRSLGIGLGSPSDGAIVGPLASTLVLVRGVPGAAGGGPGPVVVGLQPVAARQGITSIVLTFNEPLDPARAQDPGNYGYFVLAAGRDGVFGTNDDGAIPIASASYNPATARVVLTPAVPLPASGRYKIVINGQANPAFGTGLTDTAGNLLDGTHSGHAGGAYVDVFGTGKFAAASIPVPVHRTHTTPRGHLPTIRPVFHRARPRH